MIKSSLLALTLSATLLAGCSNRPGPGPLAPDYHYQASPRGTDESKHVLVDRPETMYDSVTYDLLNPKGVNLIPAEETTPQPSVTAVSPSASAAAAQELARPRTLASTQPTTAPTTAPSAAVKSIPRVWIELGGVVVQVNGRPIFAGEVIKPLMPLLSAEAKRHDADGYRVLVTKAVKDQVTAMIHTELLVAQADQVLDQTEKDLAWQLTMMWQQNEVARAGGSLEQAKARATAEGTSFSDLLQDKFRENKVKIYYQKKLYPRLQVTAQDIREYYQRHYKEMFYEPEQIQFRLIKISVKAAGREDAKSKITELKARLAKGEDFQTLATQFNDDPRLAKNGGLEQPIARGAYVNEAVENAAWKLQPGQVSDVVETPGAFYLVQVESRTPERIRPFEDLAVQSQIDQLLKKEQFAVMMEKEQMRLLSRQPIFPDPPRYELVVEMAMQLYPQWVAAK